jgi:site-specific DNA-adenine methylase
MQTLLFQDFGLMKEMAKPPKGQFLKWIGNKQRFARTIVSFFPDEFNTYHEPFLGGGAVLGTLAREGSIGADSFEPLVAIWQTLAQSPDTLKRWYEERWRCLANQGKKPAYEAIKQSYNSRPNARDLLFLCRSCYGGVVRFRQADGYMSEPLPADGLFEREILLDCGRSMLKRFQMNGLSLEDEVVHDRLLLTY